MEQQQINNEFNPPHGQSSFDNLQTSSKDIIRTQLNAQKSLRQLSKSWPTNFSPYQIYFNPSKLTHLILHKDKPIHYLHSSLYDRQRLNIERQAMYYRGAVDDFIMDEFLKEYIDESAEQKGFVNKKGNKSLVFDNVLYYAHESSIKAIELPKLKHDNTLQIYQQSLQPLLIVNFQSGNTILELKALQGHYLNTIYEGLLLTVRFIRKIVIYSPKEKKVIQTLSSASQFINISHSPYAKNTLETIQYDGSSSILSIFQLQHKQTQVQIHLKESFKIQQLVNNKINLNRNQLLLTKYQGLYSFDRRSGQEHKLYEVKNLSLQRMYSSVPMKGFYNFSPLIASCHSRDISIFDIRKPNSFIKTHLHHCQESPPEIMQFYDGSPTSHLHQPILSCHSPYSMGSSIFLPFDLEIFEEFNIGERLEFEYYKNPITTCHFKLLHDHGKSSKESGLHRIFNESLSVSNSSPDQFSVFKIDNEGKIDMEIFKYNQTSEKYQRRQFRSQSEQIISLNNSESTPSELWLKSTVQSKFFLKETVYEEIQVEVPLEKKYSKTKKKANKKKKAKSKEKVEQKMSQLKQPQTQVDLQEFLEGEYQNSSECQDSISKRKVNYADLSKFFSILKQKVTLPKPQHEKNPNSLEFSLNSTQPFSQGFPLSQSLENQSLTKALIFHSKKLMNYSILEKLKNEWDN